MVGGAPTRGKVLACAARRGPAHREALMQARSGSGARATQVGVGELALEARGLVEHGDRAGALDTIKRVNLIPSPYEWENKLLSRVVDLRRTLEEKGLEATALEIDAQAKRTASVLGLVHE